MTTELAQPIKPCRYRETKIRPIFLLSGNDFKAVQSGVPVPVQNYRLVEAEVPFCTHPTIESECMRLDCSANDNTCTLV